MSRMYDESSVLEAARVAGDPTQGPEDGPCLYSSHPPVISEPKMRRKLVSGREPEVAAVTEALLAGPGARVLLHGPSGVGKATVATAVARQPVLCERALGVEAKANSMASGLRLRGWLPGATDDGLRRAVITLFLGALPSVIAGVEHKFDAALSCIKKWLQSNDWLVPTAGPAAPQLVHHGAHSRPDYQQRCPLLPDLLWRGAVAAARCPLRAQRLTPLAHGGV